MDHLKYNRNELRIESVRVRSLAEQYGTPLYIYSKTHIRRQYKALAEAMRPVNPLICYSMKANSNRAILKTLFDMGAGFDIVSGGELHLALRAGADPSKIVFAGVGKTTEEIEFAIRRKILFFTVESEPEAGRISRCAAALRTRARIAFRANPDIDARTHKYTSTGRKENKFGIDIAKIERFCRAASRMPGLEICGIHMHIGSQILSAQPFADALRKIAPVCENLKKNLGKTFRYLDIGGGIGIQYGPAQARLQPTAYAARVIPVLKRLGMSVVMEPGRFIVGDSGILVCRVQYIKETGTKTFVIADAGMNDLIRPSLYDAYHEVVPVARTSRTIRADLVGPICESGDFLALDRNLPAVREGDLLAVCSAGAYGYSMASNYNGRPRPAEVMVQGRKAVLVRRRETLQDIGGKD